jgi:valyl-tRNA synthetase
MLPKAYDPSAVEDRIYQMWEESGAFRPESCNPKGEPFTISMPPPNATGQLHLGHAVMLALEDIFVRFARMQGKRALWVPGTDHAAIATENIVIKQLKDKGMKDPRKELGREKLIGEIAAFVEQSKATIRSQVRKMGSSCDWTRERYTFESALNRCVNEVFLKMYGDGLIYRGHRIVNWDPKLQTTVSDDEVEYREEKGCFYTFQYGPFQISTARPETKFGDKYVVMHPEDPRYKKYKHGETFEAEWINGSVRATVIKDEAIDPEFGTGVMTITPWHDHTDFAIAEKHGLEKEQVIGFDGKLLPIAGEFSGMKIEDARPLIVEKLRGKGLLVKIDENYVHNKAVSQRGGGSIEPQIKLQWFIDVNKEVVPWKSSGNKKKDKMSLKQIMHSVVHHGDIAIIPERFSKTYFHWIDNLRDWCISRQIWWGHRVPVWYQGDRTHIGPTPPDQKGWEQDPDTLDTWFSSALWTWSTLVDPKKAADPSLSLEEILLQSPDFQTFHPTSVMETGYDILFFWVARMILMTTYATGQIPFKTVYLHGLIRTRDGKKMSKSHPETMIDPLDIIPKYGADALRLSMIVGQSPGADSRLYEEKIAGYRNFINKLWNASRFVLMECEKAGVDPKKMENGKWKMENLSVADKALLFELDNTISLVEEGLKLYRLSEAGGFLYSFVWDFFCDWYLEISKGEANCGLLVYSMRTILKLLHPYCPFVTEELWQHFSLSKDETLIRQKWPNQLQRAKKPNDPEVLDFASARRSFIILIEVIKSIRKIRAEQGIDPGKMITVTITTRLGFLESQEAQIRRLGKVESLTFETDAKPHQNTASIFLPEIEVHVSLAGMIDKDAERKKLQQEAENLQRFIASTEAKLANADFVARAPEKVVSVEREKLHANVEKLQKITERLKNFS